MGIIWANKMKKFIVIENIKPDCLLKVYQRYFRDGRMLPDGLCYLNSWLEKDGSRCFQIMETNQPELFQVWAEKWRDLIDFEFIEIGEAPTREAVELSGPK